MATYTEGKEYKTEGREGLELSTIIKDVNIAERLDKLTLEKIGYEVVADYKIDRDSRQEWQKSIDNAMPLAKQIVQIKSFPWDHASSVKHPLITNACIQFNSRTYPEIIKGEEAVKTLVIGRDPDGSISEVAGRIQKHMSYQLFEEIPHWEFDMDRLTIVLSLFGMAYKKVYYDPILERAQIVFCLPHRIVVNNNISSIEDAPCITDIIPLYPNEIVSRMHSGLFLDMPLDELLGQNVNDDPEYLQGDNYQDSEYSYRQHDFLEQYRFIDFDKDGYAEPYIVTVHQTTRRVMRIVANFKKEGIKRKNGKIVHIKPISHFVDYHFMPNIDGTFHSMGYAHILYPMNEAVNTNINQLIDAGTLSNLGGGWINKGLSPVKGPIRLKPGEYKELEVQFGTPLSQNIVPRPRNDPSPVVFNLLQMLIQAAKETSSLSDVLQGQQPAQNVPATTVLALIQQGTQIYSTIQKRLYRSLKKEFGLLIDINKEYLDREETFGEDEKIGLIKRDDYKHPRVKILPVADPSMSTQAIRLARAQVLMQIKDDPHINDLAVLTDYLAALDITNPEKYIIPPDPNSPPPPELLKTMAETRYLEMKSADIMMGREIESINTQIKQNQTMINAAQVAGTNAQMKMSSVLQAAQLELQAAQEFSNQTQQQIENELQSTKMAFEQAAQEVTGILQKQKAVTPPEAIPEVPQIDVEQRVQAVKAAQTTGGPQTGQPGEPPAESPSGPAASVPPPPEEAPGGIQPPPPGEKPSPEKLKSQIAAEE